MATIPTQIRIDEHVKKQATELFGLLGLDMSSAVNMFLNQCILRGGIPFSIEVPDCSDKVLTAMEEARRISKDSSIPGYTSMEDLKKALEA